MNLTDLNKDLAEEFGISQIQAKRMLSFVNKRIRTRLLFGEEISIRKVGTFKLRVRQPRNYMNLQTREITRSEKHYFLDFIPTHSMKEDLKKKTVY